MSNLNLLKTSSNSEESNPYIPQWLRIIHLAPNQNAKNASSQLPAHVLVPGGEGSEDLHLVVETIVQEQVVRHPYPVRLHGVTHAIVVVPDLRVIEVTLQELMEVICSQGGRAATITIIAEKTLSNELKHKIFLRSQQQSHLQFA